VWGFRASSQTSWACIQSLAFYGETGKNRELSRYALFLRFRPEFGIPAVKGIPQLPVQNPRPHL